MLIGLHLGAHGRSPRFSDVGEDLVDDGRIGDVGDYMQGSATQWIFRDVGSSRSELLS